MLHQADRSAPARTAVEQVFLALHSPTRRVSSARRRQARARSVVRSTRPQAAITDDASIVPSFRPGVCQATRRGAAEPDAAAMRAADTFLRADDEIPLAYACSGSCLRGRRAWRDASRYAPTRCSPSGSDADYEEIAAECASMLEQVAGARRDSCQPPTTVPTSRSSRATARGTTTPACKIHEPGDFFESPCRRGVRRSRNRLQGTYVVDGTISPHGLLDEGHTVEVTVEDGYVTDFSDPEVAAEFERASEEHVGNGTPTISRNSVSGRTSPSRSLLGRFCWTRKPPGRLHPSPSATTPPSAATPTRPSARDGVIRDPTVYVDGEEISLPQPA
ncbi:MAG: hypothetical protein U5K28_08695 [Halobacteriales archaeon]|nr:hypothetical protein [Halobacteriales archaeon]